MNSDEILKIFKEKKALLEGHFELASKKHSKFYLQCALILQFPDLTDQLCRIMAEPFKNAYIDVVVGPAMGGIILGFELARVLGVRAIYAERKEEGLQLRRGFELSENENVLLVEDVITTGSSILELALICEKKGAKIVGYTTLVDRREGSRGDEVLQKLKSLVKVNVPTYERDQCPICREGIPVVKPGSQKLSGSIKK